MFSILDILDIKTFNLHKEMDPFSGSLKQVSVHVFHCAQERH